MILAGDVRDGDSVAISAEGNVLTFNGKAPQTAEITQFNAPISENGDCTERPPGRWRSVLRRGVLELVGQGRLALQRAGIEIRKPSRQILSRMTWHSFLQALGRNS